MSSQQQRKPQEFCRLKKKQNSLFTSVPWVSSASPSLSHRRLIIDHLILIIEFSSLRIMDRWVSAIPVVLKYRRWRQYNNMGRRMMNGSYISDTSNNWCWIFKATGRIRCICCICLFLVKHLIHLSSYFFHFRLKNFSFFSEHKFFTPFSFSFGKFSVKLRLRQRNQLKIFHFSTHSIREKWFFLWIFTHFLFKYFLNNNNNKNREK